MKNLCPTFALKEKRSKILLIEDELWIRPKKSLQEKLEFRKKLFETWKLFKFCLLIKMIGQIW